GEVRARVVFEGNSVERTAGVAVAFVLGRRGGKSVKDGLIGCADNLAEDGELLRVQRVRIVHEVKEELIGSAINVAADQSHGNRALSVVCSKLVLHRRIRRDRRQAGQVGVEGKTAALQHEAGNQP